MKEMCLPIALGMRQPFRVNLGSRESETSMLQSLGDVRGTPPSIAVYEGVPLLSS
jgi:hypothetical protein